MPHVYDGKPDGRQSEERIKVSRFRPKYRALSDDEKALHDQIKDQATVLEGLFEKLNGGRYQALAFTALEESVMWAIKELTSENSASNEFRASQLVAKAIQQELVKQMACGGLLSSNGEA